MTAVPRVHQVLATLGYGDAIGHEVLGIQRDLRAAGYASDIFVETADPRLESLTRDYRDLQHHNVTPAAFFAPWDPSIFRLTAFARRKLATLAGHVDLARGDFEYNRQELVTLDSMRLTGVFPIAIDTARVTQRANRPALDRLLDDGLVNFLFVGRIAPNKKIEDHLKLAEWYRRDVDRECRCIFVGRFDVVPRYYSMIRSLIPAYDLPSERCVFTGPVPDEELAVYYRHAAAYISLSEHESFCVPLLEAMAADVPVLAYAAVAVPETLGGAGVQFAPKDLEYAAELLGALTFDDDLRREVIAGQRRRLADFGDARITRELVSLVHRLS